MSEPHGPGPTDVPAAPGSPAGTTPTELAPHHLRLFALLVDYLLVVVLVNIVHKLLLGADWDLRTVAESPWRPTWLPLGALLILLRDAVAGQSPGKWFTGIAARRVGDPAVPPPPQASVLRNLPLVLLPVEAVLVFVDPYCRRLGDRLGGTVVVTREQQPPVTRRLLGIAIVFLATTLAIFVAEYWNVRRSAAYPIAVRYAATDGAVQSAFGADPAFMAPGLRRSGNGQEAVVQLGVEGERGKGTVEVHLTLLNDPPRWQPRRVEIIIPPAADDDAAPQPRVQDAPAR